MGSVGSTCRRVHKWSQGSPQSSHSCWETWAGVDDIFNKRVFRFSLKKLFCPLAMWSVMMPRDNAGIVEVVFASPTPSINPNRNVYSLASMRIQVHNCLTNDNIHMPSNTRRVRRSYMAARTSQLAFKSWHECAHKAGA